MKWQTVPVAEIAKQVRGVSYDKSQVSSSPSQGLIPILRAGNIQDGSLSLNHDLVFVPESCVSSQQLLRPGDIVIAASSGSLDVVGKAAQVERQWQGSFGAFCKVVRTTSDRIDPRYLHHFFQSSGYRRKVSSLAAGANINNLKNEHIDDLEIPLPPLEEQRRIAAILDRVQGLEKLAESQIKQSDALANSSFQKSIDDARRRGSLKEKGLGNISIVAGQYGATCSSALYDSNLPRYVRITDIQDDGYLSPVIVSPAGPPNSWADLQLDPGDLLFARSGATVGKTYMHTSGDGDCVFAGYLIRFRIDPKIALPEFVYGFTRTEAYRSWVASTQRAVAQPNINAKQYSSLAIPLPPLDEQQAYCATYRRIKEQSKAARKRQFHLVQLRHSLSRSLLDHQGGAL